MKAKGKKRGPLVSADGKRGSRRELARILGFVPSYIVKCCKLGKISKAIGPDNKLDFELAVQELEASGDPAAEPTRTRWNEYRAKRDRTEGAAPDVAAGGEPVAAVLPPVGAAAPEAGRADNSGAGEPGPSKGGADPAVADPAGKPGIDAQASAGGGDQSDQVVSFQDAKTRKELAQAQMAELDYRQKAGELVSARAVGKGANEAGLVLREGLMRIPGRVSQIFATETDPSRIDEMLRTELEQVLHEFTDGIDQRIAAAGSRGR